MPLETGRCYEAYKSSTFTLLRQIASDIDDNESLNYCKFNSVSQNGKLGHSLADFYHLTKAGSSSLQIDQG